MSKNLVAANVEALFQSLKAGTLTSLPVVHAAELARKLYGSDAVAVAASTRDKVDAVQAQRDLAQSFFISAVAHNDSARFERYCAAMRQSPAWKVNAKGTAIGSAAKLVAKFAAIVSTGKNMYSNGAKDIDLTSPILVGQVKDLEPKAREVKVVVPAADAPAADAPAADAPAADAPVDLQATAFDDSDVATFFKLAAKLGVTLSADQVAALTLVPELRKAA